jgi:hypothetical protein
MNHKPSQTARRIAIAGAMSQDMMSQEAKEETKELEMFTIYDHPADYPNHFVIRRWTIADGKPHPDDAVILVTTLVEARLHIKPGLCCIDREVNDDPKIMETWI